jgi:hypothetical protein
MTKLEKAKEIIKDNIKDARYGIFDSRNLAGDSMTCIYYENGLQVDICYGYGYFEVFGLSDEEFEALEKYYEGLTNGRMARKRSVLR